MPASSDKVGKRRGRSRFVAAFLVVAHALGFATSIVALMSTRTPQGTIAWAISLNTFPYVAVPAYWIFGRNNFNGYVTARQAGDLELEGLPRANDTNIGEYMISVESGLGQIQALERLAKLSLLGGNSAQLLIDGASTYTSIFEGIDRAQDIRRGVGVQHHEGTG